MSVKASVESPIGSLEHYQENDRLWWVNKLYGPFVSNQLNHIRRLRIRSVLYCEDINESTSQSGNKRTWSSHIVFSISSICSSFDHGKRNDQKATTIRLKETPEDTTKNTLKASPSSMVDDTTSTNYTSSSSKRRFFQFLLLELHKRGSIIVCNCLEMW